jgi:hypothetical protein
VVVSFRLLCRGAIGPFKGIGFFIEVPSTPIVIQLRHDPSQTRIEPEFGFDMKSTLAANATLNDLTFSARGMLACVFP